MAGAPPCTASGVATAPLLSHLPSFPTPFISTGNPHQLTSHVLLFLRLLFLRLLFLRLLFLRLLFLRLFLRLLFLQLLFLLLSIATECTACTCV